jgi:hypothetical protein
MGALDSAWNKLQQIRSQKPSGVTEKAQHNAASQQALENVKRAFRSNKRDWDIDDEMAVEDIERNGGIDQC